MSDTSSALNAAAYRRLQDFTLHDLEAAQLLLRGGSVIEWQRLNFRNEDDVASFLCAQELDPESRADNARIRVVKQQAIAYLRRNFDFPVPKPIENASMQELVLIASGRGHRQLCACTILKVMHIIHHLEARELLFLIPMSNQQVFHLVEEKVYRVVGEMLADGLPIMEFIGGRKNKDSLYTKLLSKKETVAAQIYDKLRFRLVTAELDDVLPVVRYLMQRVFPFNYVIPGQSTNTLLPLRRYCTRFPTVEPLIDEMQLPPEPDGLDPLIDNQFSAPSYRVVHFCVDLPVRLPDELLRDANSEALSLGRTIFVQTEFQIVDQGNERGNEVGDASHAEYKKRQKAAVARRLKLGFAGKQDDD